MSAEHDKLPTPPNTIPVNLSLTPTAEHARQARRVAALVNDSHTPHIVRNALLTCLAEAAEVTETQIFYAPEGDDEIQVSPRDLAWLFCIAERLNLDFQRGGIVDSEGNYLQRRAAN